MSRRILVFSLCAAVVLFAAPRRAAAQDSVTLHWGYAQGSDAAIGFNIYRATAAAGPFTVIATTAGVSPTSHTDTSLIAIRYWYYVTAVDADNNESMPSSTVVVMPTPGPPPAGAP